MNYNGFWAKIGVDLNCFQNDVSYIHGDSDHPYQMYRE